MRINLKIKMGGPSAFNGSHKKSARGNPLPYGTVIKTLPPLPLTL